MVLHPIIGVLMLFPIKPASEEHARARPEGKDYYIQPTVLNACGTVGMLYAWSAHDSAQSARSAQLLGDGAGARAQMISAGEPQEAPANSLRLQPVPQGTASGIRALSCCTKCPGGAVHSNPIFGSLRRCYRYTQFYSLHIHHCLYYLSA
jgi:hypothetical protein